jgi:hypothetical protein
MNLILAIVWFVCAIVLFAYEHLIGGPSPRVGIGGISGVWFLLVLTVYNLIRWWGNRVYRAGQRAADIARANREWERRRRPSEAATPPDPNFNFTNEPPPHRGLTDQPPSNN